MDLKSDDSTIFEIIRTYLKDSYNLRLEWSLSIRDGLVTPRSMPLFWLGLKDGKDNRKDFNTLSALLQKLNCPAELLTIQQGLIPCCHIQGIRVPVNDAIDGWCLYMSFDDPATGAATQTGYKWSGRRISSIVDYTFRYFSELPGDRQSSNYVHHSLSELYNRLLSDKRLIKESGFYLQYCDDKIKEVYLTYHWHPTVAEVLDGLYHLIPGLAKKDLAEYSCLNFRHIGLASSNTGNPSVNLYFSSPFRGEWPLNFEAFQTIVKREGEVLAGKLKRLSGP